MCSKLPVKFLDRLRSGPDGRTVLDIPGQILSCARGEIPGLTLNRCSGRPGIYCLLVCFLCVWLFVSLYCLPVWSYSFVCVHLASNFGRNRSYTVFLSFVLTARQRERERERERQKESETERREKKEPFRDRTDERVTRAPLPLSFDRHRLHPFVVDYQGDATDLIRHRQTNPVTESSESGPVILFVCFIT